VAGVAGELGDPVGGQGLGDEAVRMQGVDADEAAVGLHQLQRPRQLALRPVGGGDPDAEPGRVQAQHRAGIRAVARDRPAVVEHDIGEEALVALDEAPVAHRLRQEHGLLWTGIRLRG
jgi:hypothetical protein